MRTLYQFPLSHYCEKARWLLDHKELDFLAQNLIPGVHLAFSQLKTGQNQLPILKDGERFIAGSTQIALYLDDIYPEHRLLRSDQTARTQALEIDQIAHELGIHVRRWGLAHALADGDESLDIMIGEKGYLRQFEKFSKPILKTLMSKRYQLDQEKIEQSKYQIDLTIQSLNDTLIANGGQYFVGHRLGLADISVCAMLAPLLEVETTPWEREHTGEIADEFTQMNAKLSALPLGQYIRRIYATERHARVDWRGI